METFDLPPAIADLVHARNNLKAHYMEILKSQDHKAELQFTLDGNLVGDIGEAIAVELFGIELVTTKSTQGIDGFAPDKKTSVQIKATGTGRGPAFRNTELHADHLLFFQLDFERAKGLVVFNGPERYARSLLKPGFSGQRSLTNGQIRKAALSVKPDEKLQRLGTVLSQSWQ